MKNCTFKNVGITVLRSHRKKALYYTKYANLEGLCLMQDSAQEKKKNYMMSRLLSCHAGFYFWVKIASKNIITTKTLQ